MDADDRARRWALVLPHRERLLRLARGLVGDAGDAEACVQEALTRCVTFPGLDEDNVAGFLVVTTRRLCTDHHRAQVHATRVAAKLSAYATYETAVDEAVCDRAEAAWVTERLAGLPRRQRDVVLARAAGHSPQEIADRLSLSYRSVEALLYRVRQRAKAELERAHAGLAVVFGRWSRTDLSAVGATTSFAVTAGTALLLAVPVPPTAPPTAAPVHVVRPAATAPLSLPAPPRPPAAPRPVAVPAATATTHASEKTLPPCPFPPYSDDVCASPDPSEPPGVALLDCLRYGIDREVGLACNTEPPREPRRQP